MTARALLTLTMLLVALVAFVAAEENEVPETGGVAEVRLNLK